MDWEDQYFLARMCGSESELDTTYRFGSSPEGFAFYSSQIPSPDIWPIAVLLDLEVPFKLRSQGHGTAALQRFIDAARCKGARLALLRVGWVGDLSERDKTVAWYAKRGWTLLKIPPVEGLVVPFMYQRL